MQIATNLFNYQNQQLIKTFSWISECVEKSSEKLKFLDSLLMLFATEKTVWIVELHADPKKMVLLTTKCRQFVADKE